MSEFVRTQLEYQDVECLKSSLEELGIPFTFHEKPVTMEGYGGRKTRSTASIVIAKSAAKTYADIGFVQGADGRFQMVMDHMDSRKPMLQKIQNDLAQVYAKHKLLKQVDLMGLFFKSQSQDSDGRLHVRVSTL